MRSRRMFRLLRKDTFEVWQERFLMRYQICVVLVGVLFGCRFLSLFVAVQEPLTYVSKVLCKC